MTAASLTAKDHRRQWHGAYGLRLTGLETAAQEVVPPAQRIPLLYATLPSSAFPENPPGCCVSPRCPA